MAVSEFEARLLCFVFCVVLCCVVLFWFVCVSFLCFVCCFVLGAVGVPEVFRDCCKLRFLVVYLPVSHTSASGDFTFYVRFRGSCLGT